MMYKVFCKHFKLTKRETEMIKLTIEGTVEINDFCDKMGITPNTVNNHFKNIFRKIKVCSRVELLTLIIRCFERQELKRRLKSSIVI